MAQSGRGDAIRPEQASHSGHDYARSFRRFTGWRDRFAPNICRSDFACRTGWTRLDASGTSHRGVRDGFWSVNNFFIGASNEFGALESGLTAALFGPVISVVGGGIGTILIVFGVAKWWPETLRIGRLDKTLR